MVVAYGSTIDFILPVGIRGSQRIRKIGFSSIKVGHVVAVFIAGHHVQFLAELAERHISVVAYFGGGSGTAFLGGDDDDTV